MEEKRDWKMGCRYPTASISPSQRGRSTRAPAFIWIGLEYWLKVRMATYIFSCVAIEVAEAWDVKLKCTGELL